MDYQFQTGDLSVELHQAIDAYCERVGAAFWAEPLNAVSNGAFLIAAVVAFVLWRRAARGTSGPDVYALALIALVAVVGAGSFLFHTFAVRWAALADVIPIALFIHAYLLLALKRYLALSWGRAGLGLLAFLALSPLIGWMAQFPFGSSASYVPAATALYGVGGLAWRRDPTVGKSLIGIGALFSLSLAWRMADEPLCSVWPVGTHFMWHIFNAIVLFLLLRLLICRKPGYTGGPKQFQETSRTGSRIEKSNGSPF
ncbi:ceramidase domain-containing protein [Roseibium sp.]|uniref:ceramidase domain-containing protein n=1 Tax=Roseibium sp. TaxID=1936156 RepID=UPI003A9698B4